MAKIVKLVITITSLVLFLLLGILAAEHMLPTFVPFELVGLFRGLHFSPRTQLFLAPYIFWGAVIGMVLLLVLILVVLLYPRTRTDIKLEDSQSGVLSLKKAALEGYVKTIVETTGLMQSPNVSVKLFKHRFKVKVSGKIIPRVGVPEKLVRLEEDIKQGLEAFFGLSQKVDYRVIVTHFEPKQRVMSKRVE